MEPATAETVLGDFDDARFDEPPVTTRFTRKDGGFVVTTEGPDGALAEYPVKYTFGFDPLQQYLIEFPGGRLQSLTIAWDTVRRRWFSLYPDERIPPDDPLHWTGRYQRWNLMCADCHSTALRKNYDLARDAYDTRWAEIDVGCEACHGPGSDHVAWAEARERGEVVDPAASGLTVDFAAGNSRTQIEVCAPCHSRRNVLVGKPRIGAPLLDGYLPVLLREGLYHADGQIQGEVYVYGSFVQSRMYRRGVRCSDCHDSHGLGLLVAGDVLCIRCHSEQPDGRFPTLAAKRYDTPEHHFHAPESTGARCTACHMIERTYMEVDVRSDHSMRIPRPDLSVRLGTPNACNDCHADRSAEWAAEATAAWYGPAPERPRHFAEAFAAARAGAPDAAALAAVADDPEQSAIVRATALEWLGRTGAAGLASIVGGTRDDDALVRAAAVRALMFAPPEAGIPAAAPLLSDPVRAVRIEAAAALAGAPGQRLPPAHRAAFAAAFGEFEAAQAVEGDMPGSHLNLGVVHARRGDLERAESDYRTALRLDPGFVPARVNLAQLYNEMGRNADAERELRAAVASVPEGGELHYSLGLLLAEEQRLEEAVPELAEAARLLPRRGRVRYNLALALQHLGRRSEAEAELQRAAAASPDDAAIVRALVIFYAQDGEWEGARTWAKRLVALEPGDPGPLELLQRIEAELTPPPASGAP